MGWVTQLIHTIYWMIQFEQFWDIWSKEAIRFSFSVEVMKYSVWGVAQLLHVCWDHFIFLLLSFIRSQCWRRESSIGNFPCHRDVKTAFTYLYIHFHGRILSTYPYTRRAMVVLQTQPCNSSLISRVIVPHRVGLVL